MNMAYYLVNWSPSITIKMKTPIEVWSGEHANYSDLKIFGCPAYAHTNNGKLERRAQKCIFLGYATGVKGYRLWCTEPNSPKFIISRDVKFDESSMLHLKTEVDNTKDSPGVNKKVEP